MNDSVVEPLGLLMKNILSPFFALSLILSTAAAHADEEIPRGNPQAPPSVEAPNAPSASPPTSGGPQNEAAPLAAAAPERTWYGYQTLVADATTVVVLPLLGVATRSGAVAVTGVAGFTFATPIIHMAHGNYGYGALSFTLRAGLLVGTAAAVIGSYTCHNCSYALPWALLGTAMIGVPALDAAVFAYETEVPKKAPKRSARAFEPTNLTPSVSTDGRGASVGLSGAF